MRIARLIGVAAAAALVGVFSPGISHATGTHSYTLDCVNPVTIYGEVGDTFVFTMAASCSTDWNFFNVVDYPLNTQGLLSYLAYSNSTNVYVPPDTQADNSWFAYSNGLGTTTVTASLLASNPRSGEVLEVDGKVAEVDNDGAWPVGFTEIFIIYGGTTPPATPGGGSAAPVPTFTLTSNANERGTCWPTVSGTSGTWVKLTDSGCSPPKAGAQLLGWATSPEFPVAQAKEGVAFDGVINGTRMIFIPVNGYTQLSGDNTLYPIWSS